MKMRTLSVLTLLALLVGLGACGNNANPTPTNTAVVQPVEVVPTETAEEPTATPAPSPEPETPAALFEQAPCPMELPAGAIEGEHIACGYVEVPEVRADAEGRTIHLAVAVIPSNGDSPAADPLVMLAGGPGQSALTDFPPLLALPGLEGFRTGRDIVLVEQRGTQYSPPFLKCAEVQSFQLDTLDQDLSPEEKRTQLLKAVAACHDGFVDEGTNLSAYNSLESAADVVAVMDALGYEDFNVYGGSYGSLLAQHIMRDYPERVRSMILDAVSPLRHEPNLLYKAHSMDHALRLLFEHCQADPACDEVYPDLETVFLDTVDHLNAEPVTVEIKDPVSGEIHPMLLTGDKLLVLTRDLLYRTAVLPDLPQVVYAAADGDYALLELLQAALLFQGNLADGLYKSVVCSELADFDEADMADPEGLYPQVAEVVESLIAEVMLDPCQVWDVEPLDDYAKESVASDTPTLVLSGEFDPTVPPHLGNVAAEELTKSYVYTFPGVSHSTIVAGECPVSMMLAFLDDPSQAPDNGCLAEMAGLTFRIPLASLELEPFVDNDRGFRGLVPVGWQELAPANLARGSSALDVAYFVLAAEPITAAEMLAILASQLGFDPEIEPVSTEELGSLTWQLYAFDAQGYPADLALAEVEGKSYFVFLVSPKDEHEALNNQLFLPAVEAMTPIAPDAEEKEEAGTPAEYGQGFEVAPCPFDLPPGQVEGATVECGYLTVAEERDDPDSREIRLAVAIFHHPDHEPEPDPIIYLEGGPGGSALEIRVPSFDASLAPIFATNRDLIVFDQRGTGYSEPALECPGYTELYLELLDLEIDGQQLDSQEILAQKVEAFQACADELREVADLTAYNTGTNAADVNDLRLALGYDQVNLWGSSYGSRLALEVMRDYPDAVRSAILDAPYPPEADIYLDTPASFDRALDTLVEACAADEECKAAFPDLRGTLFETVEELDERPVSLEVVHPLTGERHTKVLNGEGLVEVVFRSLYDTAMNLQLPQAIYDAHDGNLAAFQRTIMIDILRQYIRNWGMYFSVLCHDEVPFSTWEEFEAVAAAYPEFAGFFDGFEVGGLSYQVCSIWEAGQAEAGTNEPVESDIPALVLTGEYDPIVPPKWGEHLAEALPNGYFFQFPGTGHGALGEECPQSLMQAFLEDPASPPDGSCIAEIEIPPFVVPLEAADVELTPYSSEAKGLSSMVPAGWTEASPGVLARGNSAVDQTMLVLDYQPLDAATLLNAVIQQFRLAEEPESSGAREANGLDWTLYSAETQGYGIDFALAEREAATLVVLMVSATSERDVLYEAVFLPAVHATAPLE